MASLVALSVSAVSTSAAAEPIDESAAAFLGVVAVALGTVVAPLGAMVTTVKGEPAKGWGRASLAFGSIASATGTGLLIASAFVHERDVPSYTVAGSILLGLGINGIAWGIASEATLPPGDDGIEGTPRPFKNPAGAVLNFGGRF